jgi:hypothetical protein
MIAWEDVDLIDLARDVWLTVVKEVMKATGFLSV